MLTSELLETSIDFVPFGSPVVLLSIVNVWLLIAFFKHLFDFTLMIHNMSIDVSLNIDSIDGIDCIQLVLHEMLRMLKVASKTVSFKLHKFTVTNLRLITPSSSQNEADEKNQQILFHAKEKLYFAILQKTQKMK